MAKRDHDLDNEDGSLAYGNLNTLAFIEDTILLNILLKPQAIMPDPPRSLNSDPQVHGPASRKIIPQTRLPIAINPSSFPPPFSYKIIIQQQCPHHPPRLSPAVAPVYVPIHELQIPAHHAILGRAAVLHAVQFRLVLDLDLGVEVGVVACQAQLVLVEVEARDIGVKVEEEV